MLTSWRISNFKSIREPVDLSLRPLSVICGPNSAGKSALIQSILAVSQTLASSALEEPFVLNGNLVRLGNLQDVLHYGWNQRNIGLRFVIRPPQHPDITTDVVIMGVESSSNTTPGRLRARVDWSRVAVDRGHGIIESLEIVRRPTSWRTDVQSLAASPAIRESLDSGLFDYEIRSPKASELVPQQLLDDLMSASLQNFIPGSVLVKTNRRARETTQQIDQLIKGIRSLTDDSLPITEIDRDQQLTDVMRRAFADIQGRLLRYEPDRSDAYMQALTWINARARTSLTMRECLDSLDRPGIGKKHLEDLSRRLNGFALPQQEDDGKQWALESRPFATPYAAALNEVLQEFGQRLRYLGPLRDDPRAVYAIPSFPNQRDVGLKGEYTAAMLSLYGKQQIEYPVPPDGSQPIQHRRGPLADAVRLWLEYLGIADSVEIEETTKVGYHFRVQTGGLHTKLDLMSVGVGVSQALPIIVMPLLAPKGAILILEQPEVHLHPRVQARLADFFLGITASGKQCIVETHSEHLINRLRVRIAEDKEDNVQGRIRIYFVERRDAVSHFKSIEPNVYGAITDWPEGFFDETERESSKLLRAAMEKRRRAVDGPRSTNRIRADQ